MIVERNNQPKNNNINIIKNNDEFPVGMRVLAVDDNPICLKLLESLLKKCQYHVTTTNQAIIALKMLRENKNKFDLVISDVHMPDMDGFKLLELVGLEMDLPVIMLSANGDTKQVMKGVTHGACDYLVKPIRLEELKNIWQHVVRRKKVEHKDRISSNSLDKDSEGNGTAGVNSDQNVKSSRKRKDQNGDDFEDQDENDSDNEDPSAQKKPRVVWSVELHRKFVAAVNQLGLEKAVPKKILDLMNVEKLTRENVASHLQKYRMYLKRISSVANQQANMVAALGSPDYLRMNAVNYHNFNSSLQFQNPSFGPISPAGMGFHGLSPSGMAHMSHSQIPSSSIAESSKFHAGMLPRDQTTILQGMPTSLEFDQFQQKKDAHIRLQDSRLDTRREVGLMNDNLGQNTSGYGPNHGNFMNGSLNSSMGTMLNRNDGFSSIGQPRFDCSANQHDQLVPNSGLEMAVKMKQGPLMEHGGRPMGNYGVNGAGSLEDVVTSMFHRV